MFSVDLSSCASSCHKAEAFHEPNNVQFQKISIPVHPPCETHARYAYDFSRYCTSRKVGISRGRGINFQSKNVSKESMNSSIPEFPGGWEFKLSRKSSMGGVWIFSGKNTNQL